jgi:NAD(P)H-dependent FMN reductase
MKLQIIIGSTRQGRNADLVMRWLTPAVTAMGLFDVEVLDLRDWPLPMFQETLATVGDMQNPTYSDPIVKRWNAKIKEADAFVMVTPEYNHSVPGVLKNAIDSVFASFAFRHKPVAFVSYSGGIAAGVRANEHLNVIMLECDAVPVRTQTIIPAVTTAFGADGKVTVPAIDVGLGIMIEDLAWLAKPLKAARAEGEPLPPTLRLRQRVAALAKQ